MVFGGLLYCCDLRVCLRLSRWKFFRIIFIVIFYASTYFEIMIIRSSAAFRSTRIMFALVHTDTRSKTTRRHSEHTEETRNVNETAVLWNDCAHRSREILTRAHDCILNLRSVPWNSVYFESNFHGNFQFVLFFTFIANWRCEWRFFGWYKPHIWMKLRNSSGRESVRHANFQLYFKNRRVRDRIYAF